MPASAGISFFKSSPKGELSYKAKKRPARMHSLFAFSISLMCVMLGGNGLVAGFSKQGVTCMYIIQSYPQQSFLAINIITPQTFSLLYNNST